MTANDRHIGKSDNSVKLDFCEICRARGRVFRAKITTDHNTKTQQLQREMFNGVYL